MKNKITWDAPQLLKNIAALYGEEQRFLLNYSTFALNHKTYFMQYHYEIIHKIEKEILGENPTPQDVLAKGILKNNVIRANTLDNHQHDDMLQMDIRANIQALIFNLHSLSDVVAHIIYYGLALNKNKNTQIKAHLISIKELQKKCILSHIDHTIFTLIEELITHENYGWIEALANHSKHRSVIRVGYLINVTDGWTGLGFSDLTYKEQYYPCKNFQVIKSEFARQIKIIKNIGNRLNIITEC